MTSDAASDFRIEHDSMGEIRVPADARWAAQTQRAVANFPISGTTLEPALIHALALLKAEAARVNADRDDVPAVDARIGGAIAEAAEAVAAGDWDDQFPVDVFQTGSGTSSNMNMNEVLANLASEALGEPGAVHPNDHVNASQSSNDVFPSAIHLAAATGLRSAARKANRRKRTHNALASITSGSRPLEITSNSGGAPRRSARFFAP